MMAASSIAAFVVGIGVTVTGLLLAIPMLPMVGLTLVAAAIVWAVVARK